MKNKIIIILIFITILLLITNTYSWFIFNQNANVSIESNIKSWDISFIDGEQEVSETIEFNIESIYPGMEKQEKSVIIKNNGDIAANIEYKIKSIRIFDETKILGENCTQEELLNYINTLPFKIQFDCNKNIIDQNDNLAEVKFAFIWDFEDLSQNEVITEKDKKDTELGIKAYEYKNKENAEKYNFNIQIELIAKQKNI